MASIGRKGRFSGLGGASQVLGRHPVSLVSAVMIGALRARGLRLLGGCGVRLLLVGLLMGDECSRLFGKAGLGGQ